MSQTIGSVRVQTSSLPTTNSTIGSVRVSVNPGNAQRVSTISYLSNAGSFKLSEAGDVDFADELTTRGVMTYDKDTEKFVVQDIPRLDGGTF